MAAPTGGNGAGGKGSLRCSVRPDGKGRSTMDPNQLLANVRDAARRLHDAPTDAGWLVANELAEAVEALDEWLTRGGFPPDAWQAPGWQAGAERGLRGWSAAVHRLGELVAGANESDRDVLRAAYGLMLAEGYPGERSQAPARGTPEFREAQIAAGVERKRQRRAEQDADGP